MKKFILSLSFLFIISTISHAQQLTDATFQNAVNACLSTNPVDGLCTNSQYGIMPDWDVSQVTDMTSAFSRDESFNADISNWDVSNVRSMERMFFRAFDFNQPLNSWNTSKVFTMESMFGVRNFSSNVPIDYYHHLLHPFQLFYLKELLVF